MAPESFRWFHGSQHEIAAGHFVLPRSETGRTSGVWAAGQIPSPAYRKDRVYVLQATHERNVIGRFGFVGRDRFVYEVQPVGEPVVDPELPGLSSFMCSRALVLNCVWLPS